jgi:hypothetical protein
MNKDTLRMEIQIKVDIALSNTIQDAIFATAEDYTE